MGLGHQTLDTLCAEPVTVTKTLPPFDSLCAEPVAVTKTLPPLANSENELFEAGVDTFQLLELAMENVNAWELERVVIP